MFLSECSTNSLKAAAQSIVDGHLVAFPTETVYGLGADATNESAVAKVYKAKGRPADHPLIVHIASIDAIGDWAEDISEYAINLARDFWPGPMTLIIKRSELAGDFVTGGQDTVGVRVPNHPVALGLLEAFARIGGKGVAAPSANRFGHSSISFRVEALQIRCSPVKFPGFDGISRIDLTTCHFPNFCNYFG